MKDERFFRLPDGTDATLFTLDNGRGLTATVSDFGGILHRLLVPGRGGAPVDVVLGYRNGADYLVNDPLSASFRSIAICGTSSSKY